MRFKYGVAEYDGTDEELGLLATDIVYYDSSPLCEWAHFDEWLDARYKPSEVYRAITDADMGSEIAREFSFWMAENHRNEVILQGILEGTVRPVEEDPVKGEEVEI